MASTPNPHPDAALLALARRIAEADDRSDRRWNELEAPGEVPDANDPAIRAAVAEIHAAIEEAGRTSARTLLGLLVKARIVRDEVTMGRTGYGDAVALSLVKDLERLAGEGVT